jgi:D-amino peptidase
MMDIYLYTDEEGVAGVDWWDDRAATHPEEVSRRLRARELLMGEVNAAAEGAFAAGAKRVVAVQGHGSSFIYERADPRLELITGSQYAEWIPDISSGFAGAFVVGAHARFGTPGATLAHTFSFEQGRRWQLCGREIGEYGAFAAICGAHGVPVIMASGDDKFCAEARDLLPDIETAQVKTGISLHCARHLSKERACATIRTAARHAVEKLARSKPGLYQLPGPTYEFRISAYQPFAPILRPGVSLKPISATEVELHGPDLLAVIASATSY